MRGESNPAVYRFHACPLAYANHGDQIELGLHLIRIERHGQTYRKIGIARQNLSRLQSSIHMA